MRILAYGEDALTLWAVTQKLSVILQALDDSSDPDDCQVLFRPSFGRSGGERSAQFGEFDFLVLAAEHLYLGESKWQGSSEKIRDGVLALRHEQLLRHRIFKFYMDEWAYGQYDKWPDFEVKAVSKLENMDIVKPIAPAGSLLASNLQAVLGAIQKHYLRKPELHNVLLFLHNGWDARNLPQSAGDDFRVVPLSYAEVAVGDFIQLSV
jgi:hypothetical protein